MKNLPKLSFMRKAILPVLFTLICSFQSDAQLLPCNAHFIFQLSNTANGIYFSGPANPTGAVYNWHYGDGSSGTGMNSFHSYAPGNYHEYKVPVGFEELIN